MLASLANFPLYFNTHITRLRIFLRLADCFAEVYTDFYHYQLATLLTTWRIILRRIILRRVLKVYESRKSTEKASLGKFRSQTRKSSQLIGEAIKIKMWIKKKNLRTNGSLLKNVRYGPRNNILKKTLPSPAINSSWGSFAPKIFFFCN